MSTITTQLKARFRFTNTLLRSYEQKAAALPVGAREHRRAMERVFETQDQLFDLIAIMSARAIGRPADLLTRSPLSVASESDHDD